MNNSRLDGNVHWFFQLRTIIVFWAKLPPYPAI